MYCSTAKSAHHWRAGLTSYARQQYGFGYGRLDLVAKHPTRVLGDRVSPALMMLHPIVTAAALVCFGGGGLLATARAEGPSMALLAAGGIAIGVLAAERAVAGIRAAIRFREPAALMFPVVHLMRNLAWVSAIATWSMRRLLRHRTRPGDSLHPRPVSTGARESDPPVPSRILVLIPAHNEASTLAGVVSDIRDWHAGLDLLVIDDGSTDATPEVLRELDVRWLRLPERLGVGSAIRAGLRYANRAGYDAVVRLDGDGQHRAEDIERLIVPLSRRRADVVLGSRYTVATREDGRVGLLVLLKRILGGCLSKLTGRSVTDPTSGFCALGPRAVRLLADHHPTGYPEPELHLLVSRHALRVVEVPIRSRERLGGRTSLTPWRTVKAAARVVLAMVIVPLRGTMEEIEELDAD